MWTSGYANKFWLLKQRPHYNQKKPLSTKKQLR